MDLVVSSGDREEKVTLRRRGHEYEVTLGDKTYRVDAEVTRSGERSRLLSLRIDGSRHHEVAVHRPSASQDGSYEVTTDSVPRKVEVVDPLTHLAREAHGAKGRSGVERVTAYMPGRVVEILVEEGAEVQEGQGVVVLEAMKMENEIQAEHPGVIRRLLVQAGQPVEGGDPLFEIE